MVNTLNVFMNGQHIGVFSRSANGQHRWQYATSWLTSPYARPLSLSLPLQSTPIDDKRVINYFDNLLPDNPQIRGRIAARFQTETILPFDLLERIGRDAAGAIVLLPENMSPPNHQIMNCRPLSDDELESVLNAHRHNLPLGMNDLSEHFRISIAGAQEKTALTWWNNQWCLPEGITPTTHIIKLPIGMITTPDHQLDLSTSVDNEYICMKILAELGLPVANVNILQLNQTRALAVERFDRKFMNEPSPHYLRLPYEDGCQILGLPPSQKYESDGGMDIKKMVELLRLSDNTDDVKQFMTTQVAFFALAAIDGHAKNFSFKIQSQGRYSLSPLYDVISAYPLLGGRGWHRTDVKMAMSLRSSTQGKKWQWCKITTHHFLATARYIGFSEDNMNAIMTQIKDNIVPALERVGNQLPADINETVRDAIFCGVRDSITRL